MENYYSLIVLMPLIGAAVSGLLGKVIGRRASHCITILGVAIALACSIMVFQYHMSTGQVYNQNIYTWATLGDFSLHVGFLVDNLTAMMMIVVTFVSLMVHIYTIGYMHEDAGYQRFFSYISLFTFAMLMLVMSNNFLQLFFGWEAVGLVSYLLIGFWHHKPSAVFANLKAFLVNRVGDFGFLLGIGLVLAYAGSLDYAAVFAKAPELAQQSISLFAGHSWNLMTVTCLLLFVGAMGKSAQFPLHVWLPDSMEGPTPISALIHAATMVTAGIFMVARMSPMFELSPTALSVVMVIGAITALFMAFMGLIQYDIKRVVAYSTLSQLGYMTVALGVSAYSGAVFHLMTHAFFKALLFLGAGSVIIAMHHEQDMRKMGGLKKYMPITYWTALIGSLALAGIPPFAGFFSKDAIIEAVAHSDRAGHQFAYFAVLTGVFLTAFYSFRMLFMTFHGKERMDHHTKEHLHESPWVVTVPLILLAIPSVFVGAWMIEPMLIGNFFKGVITVLPEHNSLEELQNNFHGWAKMCLHGLQTVPFWLAISGIVSAWFLYLKNDSLAEKLRQFFIKVGIYKVLENKYYLDFLYIDVITAKVRQLGAFCWKYIDTYLIDSLVVNGAAKLVGCGSQLVRRMQSGYVYHYAFAMITGLLVLVGLWVLQPLL